MLIALLFVFFNLGSATKRHKCKKYCGRLFFGNNTHIQWCEDKCKNVGKDKKKDREIFSKISKQCVEACKVQYRYAPPSFTRCEKKCKSIKDI